MEQFEEILSPIEEATKSLEYENAFSSQVLPTLSLLINYFNSQLKEELSDITKFRESLKKSFAERFLNYEEKEFYAFATILDLRFKTFGFKNKRAEKKNVKS